MQHILEWTQPAVDAGQECPAGLWCFPPKSAPARAAALARRGYRVSRRPLTVVTDNDEKFEQAMRRLDFLCRDTTDESLPNSYCRTVGTAILKLCRQHGILPTLINPTGDESLLFEFFLRNNVYSIDVYNTGEIVFISRIDGVTGNAQEFEPGQLSDIIATISLAYELR